MPTYLTQILNRTMPKTNFLGRTAKSSAHAAHFSTIKIDEEGRVIHGITKENKNGKVEASVLEVGFTAVANLYTLPQHIFKMDLLLTTNNTVFGVFSDHAANALLRIREENPHIKFLKVPNFGDKPGEITDYQEFKTMLTSNYDKKWVDKLKKDYGVSEEFILSNYTSFMNLVSEQPEEKWVRKSKFPLKLALMNAQDNKTKEEQACLKEIYKKVRASEKERFIQHRQVVSADKTTPVYEKPDMVWMDGLNSRYQIEKTAILAKFNHFMGVPAEKLESELEEASQNATKNQKDCYREIAEQVIMIKHCQERDAENRLRTQQVGDHGAGRGFAFLNKMPANFFAKLMQAKNDGLIKIDMESLADVLATAYGLEEDDLHKGNIGFYITEDEGKPQYHFFKIDHDLLFNAKIMATRDQRAANVAYNVNNFKINASSLNNFPDITGGAHYWPTRNPTIVTGDKTYKNEEGRAAFKSLKDDPEFMKAKWVRFLKQAVIPQTLLSKALDKAYKSNPEGGKVRAEIQRQTVEKIAELKRALILCPEFRNLCKDPDFEQVSKQILAEIKKDANLLYDEDLDPRDPASTKKTEANISVCLSEAENMLQLMQRTADSYDNTEGFTALHAAILDQSYRPPQSSKEFAHLIKVRSGKTPLAFALELYEHHVDQFELNHSPQDFKAIMYYEDVLKDICQAMGESPTQYFMPEKVTEIGAFEARLIQLRESDKSIAQMKKEAILMLEHSELSRQDLETIRDKLTKFKQPPEPYTFIKQRESQYYFMKKVRDEYGSTDASTAMEQIIKNKLDKIPKANPLGALFKELLGKKEAPTLGGAVEEKSCRPLTKEEIKQATKRDEDDEGDSPRPP